MLVILYGVLLCLLVPASIYSFWTHFTVPVLFSNVVAFIGVGRGFLDAISKDNLRVYFLLQRIRVWWHSDLVTKWWFAARFDGSYTPATVAAILSYFQDKTRFKFPVQVDFSNQREAQVQIDETLIIRVSYDRPEGADEGTSHITILSKTIEVSYGHTRAKLDHQILPFLLGMTDFLKPDTTSYELDVEFGDRNPFFAVYIAHLRPDQIADFRVVLHPNTYSTVPDQDKLEISKRNLHIITRSTESFRRVALDFILLSPNLQAITGAQSRA